MVYASKLKLKWVELTVKIELGAKAVMDRINWGWLVGLKFKGYDFIFGITVLNFG